MATARNAFRMAYGFGFVYDRNFADIDSYDAKANPNNIDEAGAMRSSIESNLYRAIQSLP